MSYRNVKRTSDEQFKRLTGVNYEVFIQMVEIVRTRREDRRKHPKRGIRTKLRVEDEVLMLLMHYREYRTLLGIGMTYGLPESRTCELIRELEQMLLEDKRFHLTGKKALVSDEHHEEVLADATESPVERPKKSGGAIIPGKRKGTRTRHNS